MTVVTGFVADPSEKERNVRGYHRGRQLKKPRQRRTAIWAIVRACQSSGETVEGEINGKNKGENNPPIVQLYSDKSATFPAKS